MGSVKESTLVVYWDMVWNNTKDALISRGTSENMLTATVAWFKTVSKKHQETTTHFELLRSIGIDRPISCSAIAASTSALLCAGRCSSQLLLLRVRKRSPKMKSMIKTKILKVEKTSAQ